MDYRHICRCRRRSLINRPNKEGFGHGHTIYTFSCIATRWVCDLFEIQYIRNCAEKKMWCERIPPNNHTYVQIVHRWWFASDLLLRRMRCDNMPAMYFFVKCCVFSMSIVNIRVYASLTTNVLWWYCWFLRWISLYHIVTPHIQRQASY